MNPLTSSNDKRHYDRRQDDREKSYNTLSYELDCINQEISDLCSEISKMNKTINDLHL